MEALTQGEFISSPSITNSFYLSPAFRMILQAAGQWRHSLIETQGFLMKYCVEEKIVLESTQCPTSASFNNVVSGTGGDYVMWSSYAMM